MLTATCAYCGTTFNPYANTTYGAFCTYQCQESQGLVTLEERQWLTD
jgi:endogenous inhibitor of DNA gyrase (YacG/DUF329 family)